MSRLRVDRDLNWNELATRAGVNLQQIQQLELGDKDPAFSTILKLARALELRSLDELLVPPPLEELDALVKVDA